MRRFIGIFFMLLLLGCSSDSTTGSTVFVAEGLIVLGNPSIVGESTGTPESPSGFINLSGTIESQLGLPLTGVKVIVRVLGENNAVLGSREEACIPADVGPGGSCQFITGVALDSMDFRASQVIEITPRSDQGTGTARPVPVEWPAQ